MKILVTGGLCPLVALGQDCLPKKSFGGISNNLRHGTPGAIIANKAIFSVEQRET
jgi:hypothetical protein